MRVNHGHTSLEGLHMNPIQCPCYDTGPVGIHTSIGRQPRVCRQRPLPDTKSHRQRKNVLLNNRKKQGGSKEGTSHHLKK